MAGPLPALGSGLARGSLPGLLQWWAVLGRTLGFLARLMFPELWDFLLYGALGSFLLFSSLAEPETGVNGLVRFSVKQPPSAPY